MRGYRPKEYSEDTVAKAYDSRLMGRLLLYLRPYRSTVLVCVAFLLLATAAGLCRPVLLEQVIDVHVPQNDKDGITRTALLFLALLAGESLFRYVQGFFMSRVGQRVMHDMRMEIFGHMQRMSLRFFDRNPVGRLITRIVGDVEVLNQTLSVGVVTVFGDVFLLAGIFLFTMALDWRLALVSYATVPILLVVTALFRRIVRDVFREQRRKLALINTFLQERLAGIRVVQLFSREREDADRFEALNRDHRDEWRKAIKCFAAFLPSVEIIGTLSIALILWVGGRLFYAGGLELGMLLAFTSYSRKFFQPIRDLTEKYNILQASMASSERIFHLLDTPEEVVPRNGEGYDPAVIDGRVEFRNVSFAYNEDEYVLKNVSFTVAPGERLAIVGMTGAGKTSIINLLSRFYDIQAGKILIDGTDIRDFDKYALRRHISVVLQDVFLFSGTVEENISLGDTSITHDQVNAAAEQVNAWSFIQNLRDRYGTEVGERGANISMGQRQLLAFARALAHRPSILVLDEATSSVDTATELLIQHAIEILMTGRTSITIAHRLSTIQNADRILVIHKGEIRESGSHQQLLAKHGIYRRLYNLQYQQHNKERDA